MQDKDFTWFLKHYDEFFEIYGHSFLVIKNEKIIGVYDSFKKAVETTLLTEDLGSFIIQECNGDESAYTVQIASMSFQ